MMGCRDGWGVRTCPNADCQIIRSCFPLHLVRLCDFDDSICDSEETFACPHPSQCRSSLQFTDLHRYQAMRFRKKRYQALCHLPLGGRLALCQTLSWENFIWTFSTVCGRAMHAPTIFVKPVLPIWLPYTNPQRMPGAREGLPYRFCHQEISNRTAFSYDFPFIFR